MPGGIRNIGKQADHPRFGSAGRCSARHDGQRVAGIAVLPSA